MSYLRIIVMVVGALSLQSAQAQTLLRGRLTTNDATWQDSPTLVSATATNLTVISNLTVAGGSIYKLAAGTNMLFTTNASTLTLNAGGGSVTVNTNQFGSSSPVTLSQGLLVTNLSVYGSNGTGLVMRGTSPKLNYATYASIGAPSAGRLVVEHHTASSPMTLQVTPDQATPAAATLRGGNATGTDGSGGGLTLMAGASTGTATGGPLVAKTSLVSGAAGFAVNPTAIRQYMYAGEVVLVDMTDTTVFQLGGMGQTDWVSCELFLSIWAADGTDVVLNTYTFVISAMNVGGVTTAVAQQTGGAQISTGAFTGYNTISWLDSGSGVGDFVVNASSDLNGLPGPTVLKARWQLRINSQIEVTVAP